MLAHDALLVCTDFEKTFHLDSHASKTQLGGTMCQDHGTIVCHSCRLTKCQEDCSTPEKEALSMVDVLKTCSSALLGKTQMQVLMLLTH